MTPDQIRVVVDAVFAELETLTVSRPLIHLGIVFAQQLVDNLLLAKVAAKLNATPKV